MKLFRIGCLEASFLPNRLSEIEPKGVMGTASFDTANRGEWFLAHLCTHALHSVRISGR